MFVCSDSHHCEERRAAGHRGPMAGEPPGYVTEGDAAP
jgi:alpha-D-ribose 1-methylphosphonate 5-phosphate C-P lyase